MVAEIQTYSTGRYGLVDVFYRHIWINHYSEDIMHFVSRAFWSKAATTVFDLTCFENFSESTVDTEVSLSWKVPVCQDWRSHLMRLSFKNVKLFDTQTVYETPCLVNEPTACNLTEQRQRDLQQQMLLLTSILDTIKYKKPTRPNPADEKFMLDLRQIFLTEIDTRVIYEQVYSLASDGISGPDDNCAKILHLLGRSYA